MNCIFVGLPGSGKSSVGRQLARKIGVPFADTDHVIEHQLGCSIRTYFEQRGEEAFRELEAQVLAQTCKSHNGVISTGGGAVLRVANRVELRNHGKVVYLHAPPEEIFRRLRHDRSRPLLQVSDPLAKLRELYLARDTLYREAAHFVIETGKPSVATLVNMVVMQFDMQGETIGG